MQFLRPTFLIFLSIFAFKTSFAQSNPQIRICHESNADFVVFDVFNDQLGLCKTGNSYVGAIDLMNYRWEQKTPESIQNYISGTTECPGLEVTAATVGKGWAQNFCFFNDGSIMDSLSLKNGRYDFSNQALNQLLGL